MTGVLFSSPSMALPSPAKSSDPAPAHHRGRFRLCGDAVALIRGRDIETGEFTLGSFTEDVSDPGDVASVLAQFPCSGSLTHAVSFGPLKTWYENIILKLNVRTVGWCDVWHVLALLHLKMDNIYAKLQSCAKCFKIFIASLASPLKLIVTVCTRQRHTYGAKKIGATLK